MSTLLSDKFLCSRCRRRVPKESDNCPFCGTRFRGIQCTSCGFLGSSDEFPTDNCPKCGKRVDVGLRACTQCNRRISSSLTTCRHCGHTRWRSIYVRIMFGFILLFPPLILTRVLGAREMSQWIAPEVSIASSLLGIFLLLGSAGKVLAAMRWGQ